MIPSKLMTTLQTLYLYSDGHAVIVHEKQMREAGAVRWVTIHEDIGVRTIFDNPDGSGRLIVSHAAAVAMLCAAQSVRCEQPSVDRGSKLTKERGIAVGYVALNFGRGEVFLHQMPGLIGSDFTYQPEARAETWASLKLAHRWADYNIGDRFPAKERKAA